MAVEFTIHPPSILSTLPLVILVVTGAVLIVLALATGRRAKSIRRTFVALLVIGVVAIGVGIGLSYYSSTPSTITIGNGYLYISSPSFSGVGNMNISSNQIRTAYVGVIGVGNLTISKQHGTNMGNLNVGVFTLGSGPTAYVVSDNSTSLVLQLYSGKYVILGTDDTAALVAAFSQSVHSLQGSTQGS